MGKEERRYPVKTLHDFLAELDKEWDKFRMGSLLGMFAAFVFLAFVSRFAAIILLTKRLLVIFDLGFLILGVIAVIYSLYAMYGQYRFYRRWERRFGLLQHLEEQLMKEESSEASP